MDEKTSSETTDILPLEKQNESINNLQIEHATASCHQALCSSKRKEFQDDNVCFTGLRVYDGSKILARFLTSSHPVAQALCSRSGRVVELGCGAGLAGIAAASAGARSVTFTDMQPACLDLCRKNVAQNAAASENIRRAEFRYDVLRWEATEVDRHLTMMSMKNGHDGDRQQDDEHAGKTTPQQKKYQLVLGAELFYFRVDVDALAETIKQLLDPSSGVALLCHANRLAQHLPGSRVNLQKSVLLQKHGLHSIALDIGAATGMQVSDHHRFDLLAVSINPDALSVFTTNPAPNDDDDGTSSSLVLTEKKSSGDDDALPVGLFE